MNVKSKRLLVLGAGAAFCALGLLAVAMDNRGPSDWREFQLPLGSGSVRLPPSWNITASNTMGSFDAEGPGGQSIHLGISGEVVEPNSLIAQFAQGSPQILVAPFSDPVTAVVNLMPQWSRQSEANSHTSIRLNKIKNSTPVQGQLRGPAAEIQLEWTKSNGSSTTRLCAFGYMECFRLNNGAWGYWACYAEARPADYEQAQAICLEIARSWKLDSAAVGRNGESLAKQQQAALAVMEHVVQNKKNAADIGSKGWLEFINQ